MVELLITITNIWKIRKWSKMIFQRETVTLKGRCTATKVTEYENREQQND